MGNEYQALHLERSHASFVAAARVESKALARPDPSCSTLSLQCICPAHPVLHKQAETPAGIIPALLQVVICLIQAMTHNKAFLQIVDLLWPLLSPNCNANTASMHSKA